MIGYNFKLTNRNGDYVYLNTYVSGAKNYSLLQEYPTMEAEVINNELSKEGQHGIWDFYSFYGKRLVSFSGLLRGENQAEVLVQKNKIIKVLKLPNQPTVLDDGMVTLDWTDALGRDVTIEVKVTSDIQWSRNISEVDSLNFLINLKAPNPIIEAQEFITISGIRGYIASDVHLPLEMPVALTPTYMNKRTFTVGGDADTYSIIRLYGGNNLVINNPKIINLTTGEYMSFTYTLNGRGQFIAINGKTGTIINELGVDISSHLDAGSSFIDLEVGTNEFYYSSNESSDANNPLVTLIAPIEEFEIDYKELYT
jgi:hypothetical protein